MILSPTHHATRKNIIGLFQQVWHLESEQDIHAFCILAHGILLDLAVWCRRYCSKHYGWCIVTDGGLQKNDTLVRRSA